jgi:hypothetical protein
MRPLNIILSVLAIFLLYVFLASYPVLQESSRCIGEANVKMAELKRMVVDLQWNKEQVCTQGAILVDEINSCLERARDKNSLGRYALQLGSIITPKLAEDYFTTVHNEGCAEFPDLLR